MKTTISYNDETIASLDPGQSATLLCDGQRMKSNLQVETEPLIFGKILQSTGNSETDAMSQKVITQEFENTFSKINQLESGCVIKEQASGNMVALTDSANAPIESLTIYGKTTQAVEPTPEAPQELISVGADGDIKVSITRKNLFKTTNYTKGTINSSTGVVGENVNTRVYCLTTDFIYLKSGAYVLSNATGANLRYIAFYNQDKEFISATWMDRKKVFTFTVSKDCYARVDVERDADVAIENYDTFAADYKFMLEVGTVVTEYEPYKEPQTMVVPTPIALNGIPTSKNGNFTDSNGQQWVTDEIDYERGVLIKRIGATTVTDANKLSMNTCLHYKTSDAFYFNHTVNGIDNRFPAMANFYKSSKTITYDVPNTIFTEKNVENMVYITGSMEALGEYSGTIREAVRAYLGSIISAENPLIIYYVLATPIETQLTEAELVAYKDYYTNYPNTTIYSDDGAFLNIKYKADTKQYIDNKFNSLEKAILSLGGNV